MPATVAIILNGISRKKKRFYRDIFPELSKNLAVEVFETERAGHAFELAAKIATLGFRFIISAGGDGTLNQVVNGLQQHGEADVVLGIIPLGTGNDFARTCGLRPDASQLLQLIKHNQPKSVDLGRLTCRDEKGNSLTRYFLNASSIGLGPAVVRRLANSNRRWGPLLTYWKAITATFFTYQPQTIHCQADDWDWQGKIRVLTVANGRSFGNALFIAPAAKVDDGMLNVFIAGEVPLGKFLLYQTTMKTPKEIKDPDISYRSATRVLLECPESCAIETEGELAGFLPAEIEVVPKCVNVLTC